MVVQVEGEFGKNLNNPRLLHIIMFVSLVNTILPSL